VTLLRLITGPFGAPRCSSDVNEQNGSVLEERRRDEEDLIDTVLEIVFRVMWKGVEGFGESDWRVKLVIKVNLITRLALSLMADFYKQYPPFGGNSARIFGRGHYLFREANSFTKA